MHSTACVRCHRRKVRCDKSVPQCSPCTRANVSCQYMSSDHQVRRHRVQKLEQRIRELEADKEALSAHLQHSRNERPIDATRREIPSVLQDDAASPAGDDGVAEHVVNMSLIAGGGHHFVGSSSGLLLATLLESSSRPSLSFLQGGERQSSPRSEAYLPHEDSSRPAKSLAQDILQAYCSHDHLCYPFVSTKALYRSLDAVYDTESHDPVDLFFVDISLAIGTAQARKLYLSGICDAETHFNRAMKRITDVLARGGIERLQALLFICQYKMGSTSGSTSVSVWHLIGVAARACLEMGLHRSSTYVGCPMRGSSDEEWITEEIQTKQRCLWSLVALDRIVSLALGRPFAIQLEDIDLDVLDCLNVSSTSRNSSVSSSDDISQQQAARSIFVHIVRYRLICGKISNALYRTSSDSSKSSATSEDARDALAVELQEWYADTTKLPLTGGQTQPQHLHGASSFRSEEWYRLIYHNAILMLFRPSPSLCDAAHNNAALQHIYHSSREAIHLYSNLHRSRRMNYSWITMHSVFLAGLSYIYALRNHFQSLPARPTLHSTPTIGEVVNDTRACSKVLLAVAERGDIARDCSQLFDKLSDALIADVLEAQKYPIAPVVAPNPTNTLAGPSTNDPHDNIIGVSEGFYDEAAESDPINMTIDSTFRHYFGDLQSLGIDEYHNDALSRLSQDWFLSLGDDSGVGSSSLGSL